jgi:acid phosphatase type 7
VTLARAARTAPLCRRKPPAMLGAGPPRTSPAMRHIPARAIAPCRYTAALLLATALGSGCAEDAPPPAMPAPFRVPGAATEPLRFIVYGDIRFTAASERTASVPAARQALVAQIAAEAPAAVLLTGDVPWHGGSVADYEVYRAETAAWRERGLPVYAALGNHEFAQCAEAECLENWWQAFPALRRRRWYSVAVGARLVAIALDTDAWLEPAAAQRRWLDAELARLPGSVDFIVFFMHHPPVADEQSGSGADHNPRSNERALAAYLGAAAARSRARFVVCAGHVHNYERREQDGIVYLVSGGGGAQPVEVVRDAADRYQGPGFPNFHYLRFTLERELLRGEMLRLEDFDAASPGRWLRRDVFELRAASR